MLLGGFGAAVIDWKQFGDMVFVKGRYLIKYFYIFTCLFCIQGDLNEFLKLMSLWVDYATVIV